jgi:hypothetical protein
MDLMMNVMGMLYQFLQIKKLGRNVVEQFKNMLD